MKRTSSPLAKYLRAYEQDPNSKVFAPLAESYRRLGMYRQALKVLKRGMAQHPHYLAGRVVLAHVYYDSRQYQQVLKILKPLVAKNRDHYVLQKLYAQSSLQLGFKQEALVVLKNLHFLNPKDHEVINYLRQLEPLLSPTTPLAQSHASPITPAPPIEEWVRVDFGKKMKVQEGRENAVDSPIVTHTLVDLYQKQGMAHRAIEMLEKMIEHDPNDSTSKERLEELKRNFPFPASEKQNLMDIWDEKFSEKFRYGQLEKVLLEFLHAIKLRQNEKSTCYQRS